MYYAIVLNFRNKDELESHTLPKRKMIISVKQSREEKVQLRTDKWCLAYCNFQKVVYFSHLLNDFLLNNITDSMV